METLKLKWLTVESFADFELLFGEKGACGGCWCAYWRSSHSEFERDKGERNREKAYCEIETGKSFGILAYLGDEPIGWCSVAPREDFKRLGNSRILKPVDTESVWSIVCFFIDKNQRGKGYSTEILNGIKELCRKKGAKILEGYPVTANEKRSAPAFVWTGLENAFLKAGFKEVARRSPKRPIMRYYL